MYKRQGKEKANAGLRWWQDPLTVRDESVRVKSNKEVGGSREGSSGSTARGRTTERGEERFGGGHMGSSSSAGSRKAAGGFFSPRPQPRAGPSFDEQKVATESMRRGRASGLNEADVEWMIGLATKKHKEAKSRGELRNPEEPQGMYRSKEVPHIDEFRRHCSEINLLQLEMLRLRNPRLHDVYIEVYVGRMAESTVNALIGKELRQLNVKAATVYIDDEEADRLVAMSNTDAKKFYGDFCDQFLERGRCHKSNCERVHARSLGSRSGR